MKKLIVLVVLSLLLINTYSQDVFITRNRDCSADMDQTIDGIWSYEDASEVVADSVYLYRTGSPDFGDLNAPDLELQVKSLWYKSELGTDYRMYFLIRHLDDSLVNGYDTNGDLINVTDDSLADGLENRDATALYFFPDIVAQTDSTGRTSIDDARYEDGSYMDEVTWFRWVWGVDTLEGEHKGVDITSLNDIGEIIQWTDGVYRYAKIWVDVYKLLTTDSYEDVESFGFAIELDENDKEILKGDKYGVQTRAYLGRDYDSVPLAPRNVVNWSEISFQTGSVYERPATSIREVESTNFARVYPNPVKHVLNFSFDTYSVVEYTLFDMMGRVVQTGAVEGSESSITISDIPQGSYYLKLHDDSDQNMVQKLLIME